MSMLNLKVNSAKKRARCTNFSAIEENTLVALAVKHSSVLECKKSDHDIWESKNAAWRQIQEEFIAATGNNREVSRSYVNCTLVIDVKYKSVHFTYINVLMVRYTELLHEHSVTILCVL